MDIGPIIPEDLPALSLLYQQLVPNDPAVEKMREALAVIQRNPNEVVLGAKIKGQLVGTVLVVACQMLFGQCKSFAVVEDVVVDSGHRHQGVGTALMREVERWALARNCRYLMLITDTDRAEAQRFYESLGYETDHYCGFKKML